MLNMKMKVSYVHRGYNEKRNILYNKNVHLIKEMGFFKILSFLYFKIIGKVSYVLNYIHYKPFKRRNYHFFNVISFSKKSNWITSFETFLPRLPGAPPFIIELAIKKISLGNCKKLIALSQCTFDIQYDYLLTNYPSYLDLIMSKCIVLHPPQRLIVESLEMKQKYLSVANDIVFSLVGSDFFRKGGMELIKVFNKLKEEGIINWHLNIVSSLNFGDYATKTSKNDYDLAIDLIESNEGNISLFNQLSNVEVIELFKKSHIGLLPTWAETYGYSLLEAQACGCPVISTDIRAMPEINNNDCGWVIKVPKDSLGNGILETTKEREIFSETIQTNLYKIIKKILESPESIDGKMKASIERIKIEHGEGVHSERLLNLYDECFNS